MYFLFFIAWFFRGLEFIDYYHQGGQKNRQKRINVIINRDGWP